MDEKEHALLALLLQVAAPERTRSQHLDGAPPPALPSPLSSAVTADALHDLPVLPAGTSSRGHSGAAVTVSSHHHSSHLSSACLSLAPLPCPVPAGMSAVGMCFLSPR